MALHSAVVYSPSQPLLGSSRNASKRCVTILIKLAVAPVGNLRCAAYFLGCDTNNSFIWTILQFKKNGCLDFQGLVFFLCCRTSMNLANTDSKRAELSACIIIMEVLVLKKQWFYEFFSLWDQENCPYCRSIVGVRFVEVLVKRVSTVFRFSFLHVCLFVCKHVFLFVSKFSCFLLLLSLINFFGVATKNMERLVFTSA